jgi:predicted AAA+ superfamily ATPase
MEYKKRNVEEQIKEKLEYIGGILVEGPKWCGKTMTSSIFSKTIFEFQNPLQLSTIQSYISISNNYIFDKEKPILFDEWQEYPPIWDFVRLYIDKNQIIGGFIFTGSTNPLSLLPKHSGAGRIGHILMRPMSLYESGESTGSISLKSQLNKIPFSPVESNISINDMAYLICRGGWPGAINIKKKENSLKIAYDIYESLINSAINNGTRKRDKDKISKMIKLYARNISTLASYKTLYLDRSNNSNIDDTTFFSYLNILQELFVIENVLLGQKY